MRARNQADRVLPPLVFGVFFILTLLATWYVWSTTRSAERARFDNAVQATQDAIRARLDTYIHVLTATRALAVTDPEFTRAELRGYIRSLHIHRQYPGIQGIGLTVRIPPDEVSRVEEELRSSGIAEFRVWPETPRDEYHAIVILEPPDRRNRAAMGYDMYTHPVRREAMERARDTGRPAASGKVTLVQEIDVRKQPGFLLYTPLYATGETPPSLEERRETLVGFIYAPFRAHDLLAGIFGSQSRPVVGFEIRDDGDLLYVTDGLPDDPRFVDQGAIEVAGRVWDVRWISRRSGSGGALWLATATMLGGLIITSLLSMLLRAQLKERQQAEDTAERLRESEAALQQANRAKDEFLATLSHELRTPMTSIMGWSEMLADKTLDAGMEQEAIDAIRKSAKVQAQLIDDLLDLSRITAGKMMIEPGPVELSHPVMAALDTVRAAAQAKGVRVEFDLAPDVWVNGDAHRLQQVVWNLVSNSVKFTPEGGEVSVTLRSVGNDAVLRVQDNGHGIEPHFMPHVFERFRQADSSTTRTHMGLGLGLAIVRHLLELHGGAIKAFSEGAGRGSTFEVRLPLLDRSLIRPTDEAAPSEEEEEIPLSRLLIVDDDDEVRHYVSAVFSGAGTEVRSASSARAAMDVLGDWTPDVVLTDLAMPEHDGFDLLRWIRSSSHAEVRGLPVVALTAFAASEDRQRATESGFQAFVAKPVDPAHLRAAVGSVLRPGMAGARQE
jgi:signal transduction histidine kinase/ActR/RegA family two-component response regulator/type II secretory pathway pseudopilin PulG